MTDRPERSDTDRLNGAGDNRSDRGGESTVWEVRLRVPERDLDVATDRLWSAGARAVQEMAVHEQGGVAACQTAERDTAPMASVELRTVLANNAAASRSAVGPIPGDWQLSVVQVDLEVSHAWREQSQPIVIANSLAVVPAWCDAPNDVDQIVWIEPGAAFGLGDHPSTRLCLEVINDADLAERSVLDVGTGTGVLAITAALLGAHPCIGIDISEVSISDAEANAHRNGVVLDLSTTPLSKVEGEFDLVCANILAPTLVKMAPDLQRVTDVGGRLLIAGILADAHDHVLAALDPMVVEYTRERDGWVAVTLRWPPTLG